MNRAQHIRSRLHSWELDGDLLSAMLGTANEGDEAFNDAPEANHINVSDTAIQKRLPSQSHQRLENQPGCSQAA